MSKRDKLRRKLSNNPKGAKFSDIETLLRSFGFVLTRVSGSHHVFRYNDQESALNVVVPVHGNQVKAPYVKEILALLNEAFPEDQSAPDQGDDDEQDD